MDTAPNTATRPAARRRSIVGRLCQTPRRRLAATARKFSSNPAGPAAIGVEITTILNTHNVTLTSTEIGKLRAPEGQTVADHEYGPFGEPVRATGPVAKANPFRFSSNYADEETGLVYYGYRYYNPVLGRWISRDPIGERVGLNAFAFVRNSTIGRFDLLGLYEMHDWLQSPGSVPVYENSLPLQPVYDFRLPILQPGNWAETEALFLEVTCDCLDGCFPVCRVKSGLKITVNTVRPLDLSIPPFDALVAHERQHVISFNSEVRFRFIQPIKKLWVACSSVAECEAAAKELQQQGQRAMDEAFRREFQHINPGSPTPGQ